MREIFIIDRAGTAIYHKSFRPRSLDPDIISALISAVNMMSEVEFGGQGIEAILMDGVNWVFAKAPSPNLLAIAVDDREQDVRATRTRLEFILTQFIQHFHLSDNTWSKQWDGNTEAFLGFHPVADELVRQWGQVDKKFTAADIFDILGIYQQLFNILAGIIRDILPDVKRTRVTAQLRAFYAELSRKDDCCDLANVNYDGDLNWNVLLINPMLANPNSIKSYLADLLDYMANLLLLESKGVNLQYEYSKMLYPFLLQKIDLLRQLGLEKDLFETFLR